MIPLYSTTQVREADKYAINQLSIPSIALMENASRSIYSIFQSTFPELTNENEIAILCGKGNNGGDGFALARHFINDGYPVRVVLVGRPTELSGDAKTNYDILKKLAHKVGPLELITFQNIRDINKIKYCSVIFDALLGTGAKGELKEPYKKIVDRVNKFIGIRVSIDSPTGLDLDKGSGDVVFDADLTVTLAELKTGLFYNAGYKYSGEVKKGYIGIGTEYFEKLPVSEYLIEPEDAFLGIPLKQIDSHKYSSGKVLTIAGSGKLPGAASLTANSVLYGGAGASILAFPTSIKGVAQSLLESAIVDPYEDGGDEFLKVSNVKELQELVDWADVIAIGPGLGRDAETQKAVVDILKHSGKKNFVIDADGMFALRNNKYKNLNFNNTIFTPHHGEFASLLGISSAELKKDILSFGKKFVKDTGSYLVLKGAPTIVFTPNGEALINTTGNSGMASFGTGDVLCGLIASFVAQSGENENSVLSAVYIHSLAADLLLESMTEHGITANSLMKNIPKAIKFIDDSITKNYL